MPEPLTKEQQIQLMSTARQRHVETLDRWAQDKEIQEMLRKPFSKTEQDLDIT